MSTGSTQENLVKFGFVVPEIFSRKQRHTQRLTEYRNTHYNTTKHLRATFGQFLRIFSGFFRSICAQLVQIACNLHVIFAHFQRNFCANSAQILHFLRNFLQELVIINFAAVNVTCVSQV